MQSAASGPFSVILDGQNGDNGEARAERILLIPKVGMDGWSCPAARQGVERGTSKCVRSVKGPARLRAPKASLRISASMCFLRPISRTWHEAGEGVCLGTCTSLALTALSLLDPVLPAPDLTSNLRRPRRIANHFLFISFNCLSALHTGDPKYEIAPLYRAGTGRRGIDRPIWLRPGTKRHSGGNASGGQKKKPR